MNSVLVTGARGLIGRWAVQALVERGFDVYAATTQPTPSPSARANEHWFSVDLLDSSAASALVAKLRPTHMLHLAWITTHGAFWSAAVNEQWRAASLRLARSFARHGGRRLVVAGTSAEYDWSPEALGDGICHEERTPIRPATLYGRSKARLFDSLTEDPELQEVAVGWGRVFSVYGPGEDGARLIPSLVQKLLENVPVAPRHGSLVRDYLHARDAGAAFASLVDSPLEGPVNVASGIPVGLSEIAFCIAQQLGRADLVTVDTATGEVSEPPVLVADVTRMHSDVPYTPRVPLVQGLREVIAWWAYASAMEQKL